MQAGVGGAEVTQEPQAHLPQGEARIRSASATGQGRQSPQGPAEAEPDPPAHTERSPRPCRPSRNLPISQRSQLRSARARINY